VEEVIKVNRKLIRTTLAEIKGKERSIPERQQRERTNGASPRGSSDGPPPAPSRAPQPSSSASAAAAASAAVQVRKRTPPPTETNAELFYYKKQIDAHTPMVIVLQDGEEIEGTIEWYDRGALKVNRKDAPNLLVLKHNIKYMFKQEERQEQKETA
jgi:sRNA-binding regulator protein Hfq